MGQEKCHHQTHSIMLVSVLMIFLRRHFDDYWVLVLPWEKIPLDWMNCSESASYFSTLCWQKVPPIRIKMTVILHDAKFKKGTLFGGVTHLAQGNNLYFLSFVISSSVMMLTQLDSEFLFFKWKKRLFCWLIASTA